MSGCTDRGPSAASITTASEDPGARCQLRRRPCLRSCRQTDMIQVSGDIENWSGVKSGCRLTPGFAQPAGGGVRGTG